MRIAFLTWRDRDHPDGGGSEVYVESVARELVARGHTVDVRCARYPGSSAAEHIAGVRFLRRGGRLTVYPRALLWTLTHRRRYDVVVDVINGVPFLSRLVRRRGVVALVHHLHREQWHIIYPGFRGRLGWWIESSLTPRIYVDTPFLTVSHSTRLGLEGIGIDPGFIHVAHNGLDPRPHVPGDHDPQRVCVLGRLVPHKRIDHAFMVINALRLSHPGLTLDVIGDGWWRDELEEQAREMSVADRVVFHGRVSDERRDALLAGAALLLVPSVQEGWCLAVMEASAQGTPALAYRSAGGVTESVVDGQTGRLVDTLDELIEMTGTLLADHVQRTRLGEQAQARAREFTWQHMATTVEAVLRSVTRREDQSP